MSRTAKQFFYGSFYCALLALVVLAIIPRTEEARPIPSPASEELRPLEIRGSVTVMKASDGSAAFLARIWNPNATHAASSFPYSFRVVQEGEVTTETPRRNGFVYPLETTALVETLPSAMFAEDADVTLVVGTPTWDAVEFSLRPALVLVRAETSSDDIGAFVEGEVRNTGVVTAATTRIAAIVKDSSGFPLFAAQTLLESVPGGASRTFFIRFPRDKGLLDLISPGGTELIMEAQP